MLDTVSLWLALFCSVLFDASFVLFCHSAKVVDHIDPMLVFAFMSI